MTGLDIDLPSIFQHTQKQKGEEMAVEPEELWLSGVDYADADAGCAELPPEAPRIVEIPEGLDGWPRQGKRFWSGLVSGEAARFLDTLSSLADEDTARALFGTDSSTPATRLLVLLFDCFGGLYTPALDWRTWCGEQDPVISVVDRTPLGSADPLTDQQLATELCGLCRELFRDERLGVRDCLAVDVVEDGTFRIGPAPLVRPVRTLLGLRPTPPAVALVGDGAAAAVGVGVPAVVPEAESLGLAGDAVAPAAQAGRKRKAGGLEVAGADGRGDGRRVRAARAHRRDARQVLDGRAGPEGEVAPVVLAVAVADRGEGAGQVGDGHAGW